MKIGVYLVDTGTVDAAAGYVCAQALIHSARATMPGVEVAHLTDEDSSAISEADVVLRLPNEPMAMLRMRHQSQCDGDWLFVDTDIWFQRDVRKVFETPFDVGITTRNWPHLKVAAGFSERMPYNVGVMFSRCPAFWASALKRLSKMDPEQQQWMGDQQVICDLVAAGKYHVAFLKGSRYNYPPDADPTGLAATAQAKASILHYKGLGRKALMLERIRREAPGCV